MRFEVYEDNGGGINLAILNDEGKAVALFTGFEFGEKGILLDAIQQLEENEDAYKSWEGDLLEIANRDGGLPVYYDDGEFTGEYNPFTLETLYCILQDNDDLIADGDFSGICTLYTSKMGAAGNHVFNLPDPLKYNIE